MRFCIKPASIRKKLKIPLKKWKRSQEISFKGHKLSPRGSPSPFPEKPALAWARNHWRLPHLVPCTLTLGLLLSKMGTDMASSDWTLATCSSFWVQPVLTWCSPQGTSCPWLAGNSDRVAAAVPCQASGSLSPRGTSDQASAVAPGSQPLPGH